MVSNVTQRQRRFMLPLTLLLGVGLIVALLVARYINASANVGDIANAEARYAISGSAIDNCALCHAGGIPPALNSYGSDYKNAGRNAAALAAIEGNDSDGDGFSNLAEFTALTYPGDANSFPAATPTPTATTAPSNTPTATATATGQPTATATSTGQPTATPTGTTVPGTATATLTPTLTGTVAATLTPNPTTTVAPCKDGDDDDKEGSEISTTQHDDGDDDCETETPRMTRTPKPTSSATPCVNDDDHEDMDKSSGSSTINHDGDDCDHDGPVMTRTPKATEGSRMTKTPKPTEGPRMTKTPKPTEVQRMTRTPKATEVQRMTRTPYPTETSRRGDDTRGSASPNFFQVFWSKLDAVFHRTH